MGVAFLRMYYDVMWSVQISMVFCEFFITKIKQRILKDAETEYPIRFHFTTEERSNNKLKIITCNALGHLTCCSLIKGACILHF